MKEKQRKNLSRLDKIDLILSVIAFIVCCIVFLWSKNEERFFFYFIACLLGINIVHDIKLVEKERSKKTVIKYSKKLISAKELKKVSY